MYRITHGDLCVNGSRVPSQTDDRSNESVFDTSDPSVNSREKSRLERLQAANERLFALRQQAASRRADSAGDRQQVAENSEEKTLPAHLGWGSVQFSRQAKLHKAPPSAETPPTTPIQPTPPPEPIVKQEVVRPANIQAHPSILTAMLREEVESIGRIWLLARHIDQAGRGWLSIDELREHLTDKQSSLRCVGWRRLRQILTAGEGRFWNRDPFGRIFLYGTTRVAQQLDVEKLTGQAVLLPIKTLTASIGTVRANFYSSFHSGRAHYDGCGMPISRLVLTEQTGVSERSQRTYDLQLGIERHSNYTDVIGDAKEAHWQHVAVFQHQGKLMRRLPNSYEAQHKTISTRHRKRINQQLRKDLVKIGTQGNDRKQIQRVFYTEGRQAVRATERGDTVLLYDAGRKGRWNELKVDPVIYAKSKR